MSIDMEKIRRETLRWTLLLALENARTLGAVEEVMLSVCQGMYANATKLECRREMDYLAGLELITIDKKPHGRWIGNLTAKGINFVEFVSDPIDGIARPLENYAK
jgi:hypothetical protein